MTLSEFSLQARIVAKLLLVLLVVFLIIYLLVLVLLNALRKPMAVDLGLNPVFGSISRPIFEEQITTPKLKFALDTIGGDLPETTPSAQVYYVPEPKSTLAYLTRVDNLAKSFDFDTDIYKPQTLNDRWVKYEDASRILEVNIVNYHFKYYLKPGTELQQLVEATPEAKFNLMEDEFVNKARQEMLERDAYPSYLASGTNNPVYQNYDLAKQQFVPYKDQTYPQAIRIDFFRQDEALNIITPKYFNSQNYVILAPLNYYSSIVEMQYLSYDKLNDEPGVYPLLTSKEAFEKLKKGEASVISYTEGSTNNVKIKKIDLGYYDGETYQPYFQPIFVFLGSDNFVAYLPAIRQEYLLK